MPGGKGKGGKKHKKRKKGNEFTNKRELVTKSKDQEYGKVTKMLGNCRLNAKCTDFVLRNCMIRGKFRKRVWIKPDDIILVEKDPFQKDKGMIVLKYFPEECKRLEKMGELVFEKLQEHDKDDSDDDWFKEDETAPKPKKVKFKKKEEAYVQQKQEVESDEEEEKFEDNE